jgi:hypothetical protein
MRAALLIASAAVASAPDNDVSVPSPRLDGERGQNSPHSSTGAGGVQRSTGFLAAAVSSRRFLGA